MAAPCYACNKPTVEIGPHAATWFRADGEEFEFSAVGTCATCKTTYLVALSPEAIEIAIGRVQARQTAERATPD